MIKMTNDEGRRTKEEGMTKPCPVKGGSASQKAMPEATAGGANIRWQSRIVANALRATRSTLDETARRSAKSTDSLVKQIFPDLECRPDRALVSASHARHAPRCWLLPSTIVFLPNRFRARR